jgi:hypothetical protein
MRNNQSRADKIGPIAVALAVIAATLSAVPASATTNLIANGDFGTGDFTDWTLGPYGYGGATGNGGGSPTVTSFNITGSGAQTAAQLDVGIAGNSIQAGQGGGISFVQSFTTSGGTIDFSAAIAAVNTAQAATNLNGGDFAALINGVQIAYYSFGSIAAGVTDRATLSGTDVLSGGTYNLEIDISRPFLPPSNLDQYISNIVVDGPAVGGVPEPATWAMMLIGFGGIGWAMRRQARNIVVPFA